VINQLKKGNLIYSVQGCNGGYRLTEEAGKVSFYDIICLMEGEIHLNRCLEGNRFCNRGHADYCEIHKVLQSLQDELVDGLKGQYIVDVWKKAKPVRKAMAV
jgi:Rrf2 family protein